MQLKQWLWVIWRPLLHAPPLLDVSLWKTEPRVQRWIAGLVIALLLIVVLIGAALIWLAQNLWLLVLIGVVLFALAGKEGSSQARSVASPQGKPQKEQNTHATAMGYIRASEHRPSRRPRTYGYHPYPSAGSHIASTPTPRAPERPVEQMTGREFEAYVGEIFRRWGYSVTATKVTNDQGVDLVLRKDSKKIAVQCKRMRSPVGNSAVQQVVAGKHMYGADEAWVVASSSFTRSATNCAVANSVRLIDGNELRRLQRG